MKDFKSILVIATATFLILTSCQNDNDEVINRNAGPGMEWRNNSNSAFYPPTAHPFGKSYEEWAQTYWNNVMPLDCEEIFTNQIISLDDNVSSLLFFVHDFTMDITLSKNESLFISLASWLDDYPCPYPDFEPAEGQSLEDFLQADVSGLMDLLQNIEISFDGAALEGIETYQFISDLFYFTANPELVECFDPCVTGESQPGVAGGYFVMFKKMQTGTHTITMHGELPAFDLEWDITLNVTVE